MTVRSCSSQESTSHHQVDFHSPPDKLAWLMCDDISLNPTAGVDQLHVWGIGAVMTVCPVL